MEPTGVPAPAPLRNLLDQLFQRVEQSTGWKLTTARSTTLEIIRDGQGYRLFAHGRFTEADLDAIEGHPA